MTFSPSHRTRSFAFTTTELLVVVGVIAVMIAVLLPALTSGLRTSQMADSMNRMRQIATWMSLYSSDNRETIVPSQFDYSATADSYPVKVRSDESLVGSSWGDFQYQGTWADILWTVNDLGSTNEAATILGGKFKYDTPEADIYDGSDDENIYSLIPGYDSSPFRSAAPNTRMSPNVVMDVGTPGPRPYGDGAAEESYPGFFAANDFFNARPDAPPLPNPDDELPEIDTPVTGRWYTRGQIRFPDRSMYLVDSVAGEVIEPFDELDPATAPAFDNTAEPSTLEVDFRYSGACLMLFLDGHSSPEGPWRDLCDLEQNRRIRVRHVDRRSPDLPCP